MPGSTAAATESGLRGSSMPSSLVAAAAVVAVLWSRALVGNHGEVVVAVVVVVVVVGVWGVKVRMRLCQLVRRGERWMLWEEEEEEGEGGGGGGGRGMGDE